MFNAPVHMFLRVGDATPGRGNRGGRSHVLRAHLLLEEESKVSASKERIISRSTDLLRFSLGLPSLFFPFAVQWLTNLGMDVSSILLPCPTYLLFLFPLVRRATFLHPSSGCVHARTAWLVSLSMFSTPKSVLLFTFCSSSKLTFLRLGCCNVDWLQQRFNMAIAGFPQSWKSMGTTCHGNSWKSLGKWFKKINSSKLKIFLKSHGIFSLLTMSHV